MSELVWQTEMPALPAPTRGKVRDVYDLGDRLLIVACDRISAYDHVLRPGIPGKGKILNQLTNFWFERFAEIVPDHLISIRPAEEIGELRPYEEQLRGRSVLASKAKVFPFECVARGYLAGSGFREYTESREVCGISLPEGLRRASRLSSPIFTPATKATSGHDENVSYEVMAAALGDEDASLMRDLTLRIYSAGADVAAEAGLILADTKFEFGRIDGQIHLIDEVLTPDSSRYWDVALWQPGTEPASYDKQFVRNWLDESGWDRESPPPELPEEVVAGTLDRYLEAFRKITGGEPVL